MNHSKEYFKVYCQTIGLDTNIGSKIINGKYKPYLSAIDNLYYEGNDLWDAKQNALQAALKRFSVREIRMRLVMNCYVSELLARRNK